jgi:hypothetical protein
MQNITTWWIVNEKISDLQNNLPYLPAHLEDFEKEIDAVLINMYSALNINDETDKISVKWYLPNIGTDYYFKLTEGVFQIIKRYWNLDENISFKKFKEETSDYLKRVEKYHTIKILITQLSLAINDIVNK